MIPTVPTVVIPELWHFTSHPSLDDMESSGSPGQVIYLSVASVATALALLLGSVLLSWRLQLGMHGQLAIGGLRCIVQLSILGYILKPIFDLNNWWLVILYCCFMVWLSALEAVGRPSYTYRGMFYLMLVIIGAVGSSTLAYVTLLVLRLRPWYDAQYCIPMFGMILGNTISGVSVGLSTVLEELTTGRDFVEKILALGGSRWEATQDIVRRSIKVSVTPLLNQLAVVGLVSIPGMMTGQILAGSDPSQAARYQMVIMFSVGFASPMASVLSIISTTFSVVDSHHRLRSDRVKKKHKSANLGARIGAAIRQVPQSITMGLRRVWADRRGEEVLVESASPVLPVSRGVLVAPSRGLSEDSLCVPLIESPREE